MDWVKLAQELPVNHSRRVNCWHGDCGRKKTMSITNMGRYYVAHCFGCKAKHSASPPPMTPQQRFKLRQEALAFEMTEPTLPDDFTHEIPLNGLLWLTKGGLHVDDVTKYGFGWSDKLQRVIMPVYAGEELVAVQARSVSEMRPKYLGQVSSKKRPVFKAGTEHTKDYIVLTEDMLSAARVGKVAQAWSLLGTNLMDDVILDIDKAGPKRVYVWMDNDEAGINARRKMIRQLSAVGIRAMPVISDFDPKHHTLNEIGNMLCLGT